MVKRLVIGALMVPTVAFSAEKDEVRDKLAAAFPRLSVTAIAPSPIEGLYEVEAGDNVLYYHPEKKLLFFGEIYTADGRSITAEKRASMAEKKLAQLPMDKAIKIGNGPNVVVELTDPDCPFCRKAYEWFKGRTDVTKYVFLTPIPQLHPKAVEKAQHILSAKDPGAAYAEVMSGKLDNKPLEISENGKKLAEAHAEVAKKVGLNGTPMFFVNGKVVNGANFAAIEQNLKKAGK